MHSSPWRLYKWRYDHLHVPVVVRAGKERRFTTDRSQYVWRCTVKSRRPAEPLPSLSAELHTQISLRSRQTPENLALYSPHRLLPRKHHGFWITLYIIRKHVKNYVQFLSI